MLGTACILVEKQLYIYGPSVILNVRERGIETKTSLWIAYEEQENWKFRYPFLWLIWLTYSEEVNLNN